MDVASYLLSALALLQVGNDGLRSALVTPKAPPAQNTANVETQSETATQPMGEVRPAFEQSTSVSTTGSITKARNANELLERMLVAGESSAGEQRLNLTTALSATGTNRRLDVVQAYWRMSELHARRCALQRQLARFDECQSIAAGQMEQNLAGAASRRSLADLNAANADLQQAIATFNTLTSGNWSDTILPESLPHVGGYETRFEMIFANGGASAEVQLLNEQISAWRNVVDTRAEGVIAAEDAYQAFVQAASAGSAPLIETMAVAEQLHQSELAFLDCVYRYNADIAEYALAVGGEQTPQVLAGMLIKDRVIPTSIADLAERVIPVSGSDGFRAADAVRNSPGVPTSAASTPGQDVPPRTFQPPIDAGRLSPTQTNDDRTERTDARSSRPADAVSPNNPGWEPVPGYKRDGQQDVPANGQPTPANGMRPLSDRYRSNYRGPVEEWQPRTLPQHLADLSSFNKTVGRSVTLCEVWEQAAPAQRVVSATRFWEACFAAAILREREAQAAQLRVCQRQLLNSTERPQRDLEMLALHAALKQAVGDVLDVRLILNGTCLKLGAMLSSPGSTTLAAYPEVAIDTYTQYETQLQTTPDGSLAANLADWQTALDETSRNVSASTEAFQSGGSLRTLLFAWNQHQETLDQGLAALVSFRSEVAGRVAREVSTNAQCQALTN